MSHPSSRISAAALAVAGTLVLAACGGSAKHASTRTSTQPSRVLPSASAVAPHVHLPAIQSGVIRLADGETLGLTKRLNSGFSTSSAGVSVTASNTSGAEAFNQLCSGNADIALVTQAPTAAQLGQCTANGITFPLQPDGQPQAIELAADAIVLATKNEANVGGDCLTRRTVRDIFAPGSTIDNWSQLGFDNLGLSTAGRAPIVVNGVESGTFPLFANLVLGVQGLSSTTDVRSDFRALNTDDQVRNAVTGDQTVARLRQQEDAAIARRIKAQRVAIAAAVSAAQARADHQVLAQIKAANAALAKKETVLTDAQKRAIIIANARRDAQAKQDAGTAAYAAQVAAIRASINSTFGPEIAAAQVPGVLGVFRYTYYTLYEDRLRPMEIWDPVAAARALEDEGVATDESRAVDTIIPRMRAQAGGGTGIVETIAVPPSPTSPGSKYVSANEQVLTVPSSGPVNVDTTPDCVFPSNQTITSGAYPLSIQLLAYVPKRELVRQDVKNYLKYFLGPGQQTVASLRLVPLDDQQRSFEYRMVTGKALPQSDLQAGATPNSGAAVSASNVQSAGAGISPVGGVSAGSGASTPLTAGSGASSASASSSASGSSAGSASGASSASGGAAVSSTGSGSSSGQSNNGGIG